MKHILDFMETAETVAISGHVRPDGDCAGSCLALYRYLKNHTGAQVSLYLEPLTGALSSLPGAGDVISELAEEIPEVDLFFALDCGDADRLGFSGKVLKKAHRIVCIDHHITNLGFGDANVICPEASSTSEILFELMNEEYIDKELAECLYTGILHDTGVFHHSCTSARTMEIAGKLMEKGLDFPSLIDEGFYQKTHVQNRIMGYCLMESQSLWNGLGVITYLPRKIMHQFGAIPADLGGIIDQLRLTAGVECAIFLYELEQTDAWKVSMRATGDMNVSKVAGFFGGGGHVMAAGCTMNGPIQEVIGKLTEQLQAQLIELGKITA